MEPADAAREQSLAICEHAITLVYEGHDWTELGDGARIGHWSNRRFRVALLIPAAFEGAYVAHVLEVWDDEAKALSAYWEDPEEMDIRLLKPGEWQRDFLEA